MTCISVVIPTAARPELLEVTLRSVARQTAVSEIAEVIVAENLGDLRSAAVCDKFPGLPIEYIVREPDWGGENCSELMLAARSEYVAFVCDDDVWFPGHLENALNALRDDPEAVAHFSAFVGAKSELDAGGYFWGAPLLWLAAGRPPALSTYRFSRPQVLALAWMFTPFQWSTLVARATAIRIAAPALTESPRGFYADRMLSVAFARLGAVLFDPAIDILYRSHAGNWQNSQDPAFLQSLLSEARDLIQDEAAGAGVDVAALWREYLRDTPDELQSEVKRWFTSQLSGQALAELGIAPFLPSDPPVPSLARRAVGRLRRAGGALLGK